MKPSDNAARGATAAAAESKTAIGGTAGGAGETPCCGSRDAPLAHPRPRPMRKIAVYDPPMCCSTGVCGPDVDPVLPRFAGLLAQLAGSGVAVERYNLAQQPLAFVQNAAVKALLDTLGMGALPAIYIDGELALKGAYPDDAQRAEWIRRAKSGRS